MSLRLASTLMVAGLFIALTPDLATAQGVAPTFAAPFSEHAVLQRDQPIHVWGEAAPNARIKLTFDAANITTVADSDGDWQADLPAHDAGGPYTLTVGDADGTTRLEDIMVGDVYLCSGQSNMQFPVKYATNAWGEIDVSANNNMRYLRIDNATAATPQKRLLKPAQWEVIGPDTTGNASAVCYYMSKALQKNRHIPIGFIDSYWGGTTAQACISAEALQHIGYQGHIEASEWAPHDLSSIYNAMIAPLTPYTIKAVAWYQGESNTYDPQEYAQLLPTLLADWRSAFHHPDLPFLLVQISGFGAPQIRPGASGWAEVREVQRRVADTDPNAALVVSVDFGDRTDIHPTEKTVIGQRLALAAQKLIYHEDIVASGPEATSVDRKGHDLIVHFKNTQGSLQTYSGATALGFEVCLPDNGCRFATAVPRGDDIVLTNAAKGDVVKVRYAWADAPIVNLYNGDGLPAVPFEMEISQ